MLKTLAVSASVLAFASGSGLAESTLSTGQWLASYIYKAAVYDPSEHKVGNVRDLVIDSTGNVTATIIGVSGGFLGANQKDVVIPFKELKVSSRDGKDWLVRRFSQIDGYRCLSLIRALAVVNCQSALA
jgi:sporulation protein YlmC with PRC-barrel domain